ncbi:hypothetical protein A2U01_0097965, partial [Trifolium medium]|nr:hypothetical protein [Trifolium medium]
DNMADFADELLKIAADQKVSKKGKKKVKSRTGAILEQLGPVSSSSPGGMQVSSSLGGVARQWAGCPLTKGQERSRG